MVSLIDNSIEFFKKYDIEPIPSNNNNASDSHIEEITGDMNFGYKLKIVKYQKCDYYCYEINQISNPRHFNRFFKQLENKVIDSTFQLKIHAFARDTNILSFLIKKDPNEIFLKEYIEDDNVNLEERIVICLKLCNLMKNLNREMLLRDPNASLFYISIDNFVYNTSTRLLKVIFYRFELCLM